MSVERARELLAEARVYQPPIPRPDETQGARARALDAAHAQRLALIAEAMIEAASSAAVISVPETVTCKVCGGHGKGYGPRMDRPCHGCHGAGKVRVP